MATSPLVVTTEEANQATTTADNAVQVLKGSAVNGSGTTIVEAMAGFDNPSTNISGVQKLIQAIAIGTTKAGGASTSTPNTLVKRDVNGDFASHDITVNKLLFGDGSYLISAAGISGSYVGRAGDTMTGRLDINTGGLALALKPGTLDHVYMGFYADSDASSTRSGYIGYASAGTSQMNITNEVTNGNLALTTNGTSLIALQPGGTTKFSINSTTTTTTNIISIDRSAGTAGTGRDAISVRLSADNSLATLMVTGGPLDGNDLGFQIWDSQNNRRGNVMARKLDLNITGQAPMTIASNSLVTNLNADLLDGKHASDFPPVFTNISDMNSAGSDGVIAAIKSAFQPTNRPADNWLAGIEFGTGANGYRTQLIATASTANDGIPTLYTRSITPTPGWGSWYKLYHTGNLTPTNYLLKAGDTMSGSLTGTNNLYLRGFSIIAGGNVETEPINFRFDQSATAYAGEWGTVAVTAGTMSVGTAKSLFTYSSGNVEINALKDINNTITIELTGVTLNNTANSYWKPYTWFHSIGSPVPNVKMELLDNNLVWQTVYDGIGSGLTIGSSWYVMGAPPPRGARFTIYNITATCYLRMIGVIGRHSAPYAWSVLRSGSDMYGTMRWLTGTTVNASITAGGTAIFQGVTGTTFTSTVTTGTAPLSVTSNTVVTNLNADMLDGKHASDFMLASSAESPLTFNPPLSRSVNTVSLTLATSSGLDTTSGLKVVGLPSLFTINGVATVASVTAANLNSLTSGGTITLHRHTSTIIDNILAGEALTAVCAVALNESDGKLYRALSTTLNSTLVVGVTTSSVAAGGSAIIYTNGVIAGAMSGMGFASGQSVYLGTNGALISYSSIADGATIVHVGEVVNGSDLHVQIRYLGVKGSGYLSTSGGTITGNLTVQGSTTVNGLTSSGHIVVGNNASTTGGVFIWPVGDPNAGGATDFNSRPIEMQHTFLDDITLSPTYGTWSMYVRTGSGSLEQSKFVIQNSGNSSASTGPADAMVLSSDGAITVSGIRGLTNATFSITPYNGVTNINVGFSGGTGNLLTYMPIQVKNSNTVIDRDGSGNLTFKDAVNTTPITLSQLAAGGSNTFTGQIVIDGTSLTGSPGRDLVKLKLSADNTTGYILLDNGAAGNKTLSVYDVSNGKVGNISADQATFNKITNNGSTVISTSYHPGTSTVGTATYIVAQTGNAITLPAAEVGRMIIVVNASTTAGNITVTAQSGSNIRGGAANSGSLLPGGTNSVSIANGRAMMFIAETTTIWTQLSFA